MRGESLAVALPLDDDLVGGVGEPVEVSPGVVLGYNDPMTPWASRCSTTRGAPGTSRPSRSRPSRSREPRRAGNATLIWPHLEPF